MRTVTTGITTIIVMAGSIVMTTEMMATVTGGLSSSADIGITIDTDAMIAATDTGETTEAE